MSAPIARWLVCATALAAVLVLGPSVGVGPAAAEPDTDGRLTSWPLRHQEQHACGPAARYTVASRPRAAGGIVVNFVMRGAKPFRTWLASVRIEAGQDEYGTPGPVRMTAGPDGLWRIYFEVATSTFPASYSISTWTRSPRGRTCKTAFSAERPRAW